MPEFVFRNLSVKLIPADREGSRLCDPCTDFQSCGCSDVCTGARSVPLWCDLMGTTWDLACAADGPSGVQTPGTKLVFPADQDIGTELAALKVVLQRSLDMVAVREKELLTPSLPESVAGIDQLKSEMLAVVDQLDERRERLATEGLAKGGSAGP